MLGLLLLNNVGCKRLTDNYGGPDEVILPLIPI